MPLPKSLSGHALFVAALCLTGTAVADDFQACIGELRDTARQTGITEDTINIGLADIVQQTRVLELDSRQPEFFQTFWQYMDVRVTDDRIQRGRQLLEEHRTLLDRVHRDFGVRPNYLVAFWGLETNFGAYFGKMPVLDSLATLACDPRRSRYFTSELMEALRILDAGHIPRDDMLGSWAGAMGHTQFMPSTFNAHAIDYDDDGRIDLWSSLPDAFASSARYLSDMGWRDGERWGREVRVPDDFRWNLAGLDNARPLEEWADLGIRRADGGTLPVADMDAALVLPAGHRGPAFLVYNNFRKIMRWNTSISYALAVGHLADRIAGMGTLHASAPNDERALLREEIEEIQGVLNALGHDSGTPDGMVGRLTRQAIRDYQQGNDLPADGYPDVTLLERLRGEITAREPLIYSQ
ncbi:MAG: lytic murein transglycosylase [Aquisalimonadaceae bacterium]